MMKKVKTKRLKLKLRFFRRLDNRKMYFLNSVIFLALAAIFLTWFLEYRYFINDFSRTWSFAIGSPAPFFFNAFLLWLMLVLLWGICEKPGTAAGAMWIIITAVTYAHINKFNSRGFPLLPEDFQLASEASSLTKFVSAASITRMIAAIILIIALTIFFNHKVANKLYLNYKNPSPSFAKRHFLVMRLAVITIAGLSFFFVTDFVRHNDGSRYEDTFLGTHFTAWNQNRNYDDNGFILGFLYNLQKLQLSKPDEYSEAKITELKAEYDDRAEKENGKRISAADEDVNIVVILNESFFDPSVEYQGLKFEDYYPHTGGDILPNLHRIMREYPSGYMYSLDYGGGTANIEFETFTSMTNYWVNTVPYTALIPKAGEIPSIAQTYKKLGYKTTAIHPYNGGMYKRNIALKNEGFDTFIDEHEMTYQEHDGNSEYINDRSAYQETLDVLKSSDENQVIGLVTMQNHTPYNAGNYEETEFAVTNEDITEGKRSDISIYYQSLHNSDAYLGEFIDSLEELDKKVVVLFFGDHSAGLFDDTNSSEVKEVRDLSRVTPYFVYANYDATFSTSYLPTTTPNCMVNTMYNLLNWQKDSYYYLVDDVCTAEPILAATWLEGREMSQVEILRDYELFTYDILGGKKYWLQ